MYKQEDSFIMDALIEMLVSEKMKQEDLENLNENLSILGFSRYETGFEGINAYFHDFGILILNKGSLLEGYYNFFDKCSGQLACEVIDNTCYPDYEDFIDEIQFSFSHDLQPFTLEPSECAISEFSLITKEFKNLACNSEEKVLVKNN